MVYIYVCIHTDTHTCTYIHTYTYTHTYTCTHMYTHTHTYTQHVHTHTHTQTHKHRHTCVHYTHSTITWFCSPVIHAPLSDTPPVAVHSPRAAPAGVTAPQTDHVGPDTLMTTAAD